MNTSPTVAEVFRHRLRYRKIKGAVFHGCILVMSLLTLGALLTLFLPIVRQGWGALSWDFLTRFPSRFPHRAGVKAALFGSVWLMSLTFIVAFPIGVASAVYLEEFARKNSLTRLIEANISNLAGVPSVVYGILGLGVFVRTLNLGRSVLSGSLTMALLILPVIIVTTQEALRSVSRAHREASLALGATRWHTVKSVVLPSAFPAILTGTILALSRVIGESAPLIMIGALAFVPFVPSNPLDQFTVLPIQIYNWTSRPQAAFHDLAAGGILILVGFLVVIHLTIALIRHFFDQRQKTKGA